MANIRKVGVSIDVVIVHVRHDAKYMCECRCSGEVKDTGQGL